MKIFRNGALSVLCFLSLLQGAGLQSPPVFRQYCVGCHGKAATAGINLDQLTSTPLSDSAFPQWKKVASVLEDRRMPPAKMPQPTDAERSAAAQWVRASLHTYALQNAGDPGPVTVRRLTSAEFGYTVHDLTGLDLDFNSEFAGDAVGGEGFSNFGDVQFSSDANLERYLESAKRIADHAVIGSGPIHFYEHPGKTGFELSAINRIKDIYAQYGFRTVSGEGGSPFGLEKYTKAFYVAWEYQHRAELNQRSVTLSDLAAREGITPRFAQHVWKVLHDPALAYPSSEVAARWRKLPAPALDTKESIARAQCEDLQKFLTGWPAWLFARGDVAAGGQGDESPLIINDNTLKGETTHHFNYMVGRRPGGTPTAAPPPGPIKIFLKVDAINPSASKPVIIWRNAQVATRVFGPKVAAAGDPAALAAAAARNFQVKDPRPLREVLSPEWVAKLNFGHSPDGTPLGPNDFATLGDGRFELPQPDPAKGPLVFQVDAEIGKDRDTMVRIIFTNREDGKVMGIPTRALMGDPASKGYKAFKSGVMQMVALLPPNAYGEPTPADKDPAPLPFDSTYNTPEHDEWVARIKYIRDDRFIYNNILDDRTRLEVDRAWNDLLASFEYYDNYLDLFSKKFNLKLNIKHMSELNEVQLAALPPDVRKYSGPASSRIRTGAKSSARRPARPRRRLRPLRFARMAKAFDGCRKRKPESVLHESPHWC